MSSEPFIIRLPQQTEYKLEELANATGLSMTQLSLDLLEKYLDIEAWQIKAVQEGLQAAEDGRSVSLDIAKKEFGIE